MRDSSGEGIGGVVGLGGFFEVEVETDHFLHLFLVGGAVAGHSLFDFVWGVFVVRNIVFF